jgi:hypothetical protein
MEVNGLSRALMAGLVGHPGQESGIIRLGVNFLALLISDN